MSKGFDRLSPNGVWTYAQISLLHHGRCNHLGGQSVGHQRAVGQHDDAVGQLADLIIVFHNGELVADGDPATVIASPVVQQAYLGINPEEKEEVAA